MSLTSVIRYVQALDTTSTTGAGKTGLVFSDVTAKYLIQGGTLTAMTTETIAALGTYQAPTSAAHVRIKEVANTDPTKGIYEIHFQNNQVAAAGIKLWLFLSASGAAFQPLEVDLTDLSGRLPAALTTDGNIKADSLYLGGTAQTGRDIGASVLLAANQHVIVDSGTVNTLTTLPAVPTDWLTAAGVKADAVTKIQVGLATPTNITAASGVSLAANQHVIVDSGTVNTLTTLPAIPAGWLVSSGIAAGALNDKGNWPVGKTGYSITGTITTLDALATYGDSHWATATGFSTFNAASDTVMLAANQHVIVDSGTVNTLTTLPSIPVGWLTASGIAAGALNGKGDWPVGKTGYSITGTITTLDALATTLQNYGDAHWPTADVAAALSAFGVSTFNHSTDTVILAANQDVRNVLGSVTADVMGKVLGGGTSVLVATGVIASGAGGSAPTVQEIDTQLSATHGSGSWNTATGFSTLDAAGVRSAIGMQNPDMDVQIAALLTAILSRLASGSYVPSPTTAAIADKILGRFYKGGADGGKTVSNALATSLNLIIDNLDGTATVFDSDDTTPLFTTLLVRTTGLGSVTQAGGSSGG